MLFVGPRSGTHASNSERNKLIIGGKMNLLDLPTSELKRRLTTGKDLASVMKFFFDRFVDEPVFLKASHPVAVPNDLAQGVSGVVSTIWPSTAVLTEWQLGEVSLLGINHGAVTIGKRQGIVFWASDLAVGILSIPNLLTGETIHARISIPAN